MPRHQPWKIGDIFVIPLQDRTYAVGQLVGREASVLNSVSVALFDQRVAQPEEALAADLREARAFSISFATRDLLDRGVWRVVGARPVEIRPANLPFEHTRASGFVGAKVIGSKNIGAFANAYFGLVAWDNWHDPHYLDKLVVSPDRIPANRILTKK